MSDIAQNALRYNSVNTKRSDPPNPHNGQLVDNQDNGEAVIGFDCSGFACHVIIESGYRIDYESTSSLVISKAFTTVSNEDAQHGDIILFQGHVGIVTDYDSTTSLGSFIHMSGRNNEGGIKISYFVTDQNKSDKSIYYGIKRKIVTIRRINKDRYSAEVDLHLNGSNPNAILRPLGIRVYSNHKVKTPDTKQSAVINTTKLPSTYQIKQKSVPQENGYIKLVKRIWANLPGS